MIRHFFQYKWDGDGTSDTTYLVENGYSLNHKTKVENLPIYGLEESFVASFTKEELLKSLEEMQSVKYSTELQLPSSKQIVALYFKRYKKRSLPGIIDYLQACREKYDSFKWNPDTVKKYYEKEKQLAAKGKFEELTEEEIGFVVEKVSDVLNEEFIKVLMLGQQVHQEKST